MKKKKCKPNPIKPIKFPSPEFDEMMWYLINELPEETS